MNSKILFLIKNFRQNLDLKGYLNPISFKIEFFKKTYVMVILFKNSIIFFLINSDGGKKFYLEFISQINTEII